MKAQMCKRMDVWFGLITQRATEQQSPAMDFQEYHHATEQTGYGSIRERQVQWQGTTLEPWARHGHTGGKRPRAFRTWSE